MEFLGGIGFDCDQILRKLNVLKKIGKNFHEKLYMCLIDILEIENVLICLFKMSIILNFTYFSIQKAFSTGQKGSNLMNIILNVSKSKKSFSLTHRQILLFFSMFDPS